MSEICSKCGKEFNEVVTYQRKQYCQDCYRKQIDEEANTSVYSTSSYYSQKSDYSPKADYGENAINTLSIFAKISLFAGIVGALGVFILGGGLFGPLGMFVAFMILLNGLFGWALFAVICSIASNLIAIRKNTSK